MKAKDALKILRVSRGTLTNYVKDGSMLDKKPYVHAANIIRKVVPRAFADGIEGLGLNPLKVLPL